MHCSGEELKTSDLVKITSFRQLHLSQIRVDDFISIKMIYSLCKEECQFLSYLTLTEVFQWNVTHAHDAPKFVTHVFFLNISFNTIYKVTYN